MSRVLTRIVRGGFWLWLSSLINNVSGFAFWLIISAIAGPSIVGKVSAVLGLSLLITSVLSLGAGYSLYRFYGMFINKDRTRIASYFWSTLVYILCSHVTSILVLLLVTAIGVKLGPYTPLMLTLAAINALLLGVTIVVDALVTSSLQTHVKFFAVIIGNAIRLTIGVLLVLMRLGWIGAFAGFLMQSIVILIIEVWYASRFINKLVFSLSALRDVIKAGLASWLPSLIDILGRWVGVLAIFASIGAIETGLYYVALSVSGFISMIPLTLVNLLLPVLAGTRSESRVEVAARVLKVSIAIVSPVAALVMMYPEALLALLGEKYVEASSILSLLLASLLPLVMYTTVQNIAYAEGRYKIVLGIGLAANIPRIILYYILTPRYGSLGAAGAYVIGCLDGLVASIVVASSLNYNLHLGRVTLAYILPVVLAFFCRIMGLQVLIAAPIVALSTILYALSGFITRRDVREVLCAFLGEGIVDKIYQKVKPLVDIVLRE